MVYANWEKDTDVSYQIDELIFTKENNPNFQIYFTCSHNHSVFLSQQERNQSLLGSLQSCEPYYVKETDTFSKETMALHYQPHSFKISMLFPIP